MAVHRIKRGLDLPISGHPQPVLEDAQPVRRVALLGPDYVGMKPTMHVRQGDVVKRGQLVFEDKKMPGVLFTAPGAGKVTELNRGARRVFQSLVIELNENERRGTLSDEDHVEFENFTKKPPASLSTEEVRNLLIESGLWTSLRARPFSRVADPETTPHSLFITAMDTNPLTIVPDTVLKGNEEAFADGVRCVARLTEGKVFLCKKAGSAFNAPPDVEQVQVEEFDGVHPAGTVGLHIHKLDPVFRDKMVWHLNYQDVIAIGKLFKTGRLDVERQISLAGPTVYHPRWLRTRMGASLDDLLKGQLKEGDNRVISGSVLSGRKSDPGGVFGYLGRYHLQVSALREGRDREFLGWAMPGMNKFSVISTFVSSLFRSKKYDFDTNTQGSPRAIIPIGMYEKVMPMDIVPTYLLRSLVMGDIERLEQLGILELDEEDLALCTFVCSGKINYGPLLRENLNEIMKEM